MKLTHDNYFTDANDYLSNSKVGDYLKCKNYFYRKHIKKELEKTSSDALVTGSAVDELLTDIKNINDGKYVVRQFNGATKAGKEETLQLKEEGKTILTQTKYDEIMGIAIAVSNTTAYKDLVDHKAQEILQLESPIGKHFSGLCGIPDWYTITDKGVCIITDLKTSRTTNEREYYYHSKKYGYFRQQAFYQYMLEELHPEITEFVSRHLVVGKEKDIYSVKAFIMDQNEIEKEKVELVNIFLEISQEEEFKKEDADWNTAKTLKDPNLSYYDEDEE